MIYLIHMSKKINCIKPFTLKTDSHGYNRCENRSINSSCNFAIYRSFTNQIGEKSRPFFSKENYLDEHSRDIASVIHNSWTKDSGLFAWCEYENGRLNIHQPHEPEVTNSGLAIQHLSSGYKHHAWNFYRIGKAQSVEISKEIKKIIESYEGSIYSEIDKDIFTKSGNRKLETKEYEQVFRVIQGYNTFPEKIGNGLYLNHV